MKRRRFAFATALLSIITVGFIVVAVMRPFRFVWPHGLDGQTTDIFWDFTRDGSIARVDWPGDITDPSAMITKSGARQVTVLLPNDIIYEGVAQRLYVDRHGDQIYIATLQGPDCTLEAALAEAIRLARLVHAPTDELVAWGDKTRRLSPGAARVFNGGSYAVGPNLYDISGAEDLRRRSPMVCRISDIPVCKRATRTNQRGRESYVKIARHEVTPTLEEVE